MSGRNRATSLAASPTMVGAITTLIVLVAVFLAYNANNGLPFVPTYSVGVQICDAARLGPNNEVRIGGNRVGVVESVQTIDTETSQGCQTDLGDPTTTAAQLNLKLDRSAKPLPPDSIIRVRYRSSFGLKYLEIERGTEDGTVPEGGVIDLAQTEAQTEFDDIGNTFDTATRRNSQTVLEGFGNAFAARGESLNQAIEALNPLFSNLQPVSEALADPTTRLNRLFPELADAARLIAPVAGDQADLFTNGAIAFGAISADEQSLRDTITGGVPSLATAIRTLPVIRPFLANFADFSRLIRPGISDLRASLPVLNQAISAGAKTLPRTVGMSQELEDVFRSLENLADNPHTKTSLVRLGELFDNANGLSAKVVPYQTVCNYWQYWFTYLTEHITQEDPSGYSQRVALIGAPGTPPPNTPQNPIAGYAGRSANGRFSGGPTVPPADKNKFSFRQQPILHGNPYGPAVTEDGQANCQSGQSGYAKGEALSPGQRPSNPGFGVKDISAATGAPPLGRSDLFLRQNGTRVFRDG